MREVSKYIKLNIAVIVAVFSVLASNMNVQAKPDVVNEVWEFNEFYSDRAVPQRYDVGEAIINPTKKTSIKNLKSSNKKIVKVQPWDKKLNTVKIDAYKPGKSTITGVLYEGKKKIKKFKIEVVITKYECPVATFKVGNTDYASKYKKIASYSKSFKKGKKLKINIKAKKGWKIEKIEYISDKKGKEISNNSIITCNKKHSDIRVRFTNKKKTITLFYGYEAK